MATAHRNLMATCTCVLCFSVCPRIFAADAFDHLVSVHNRFHESVYVYEDIDSAGNHFFAVQKVQVPDEKAGIDYKAASDTAPAAGATAIRIQATLDDGEFSGVILQNGVLTGKERVPRLDFGTTPEAWFDLTGATKLTFKARKIEGNGLLDVWAGGVGWNEDAPYKDSLEEVKTRIQLTDSWQNYELLIPADRDLSEVRGGFGVGGGHNENQGIFTAEFDEIQWELSPSAQAARLAEPRFARSFETRDVQPNPFDANEQDDFDLVFRNVASTYDNAVTGLAFLAEGSENSLQHARLIADAMVYAANNDRFFTDGRLRIAYRAGDLTVPNGWTPNGIPNTVALPGFSHETPSSYEYYEVEQEATDVGANAYAGIFLLQAYQKLGDMKYRDAALDVGQFIRGLRNDEEGTWGGYFGGIDDPEGQPSVRPWSSTEHAIDLISFFRLAHEITGNASYLDDLNHSRSFLEGMYDETIGLYRAGTIDKFTRNELPNQLAADANTWAILSDPTALVRHPELLDNVLATFVTTDNGVTGIDFNDDLDGVQFEMTAHLVLALRMDGRHDEADYYLSQLQNAQDVHGGVPAASRDALTTGLQTPGGKDFFYHNVNAIAATAWLALAELSINPYDLEPALFQAGDFDGDLDVDGDDLAAWISAYGVNDEADGNGDGVSDGLDFLLWQLEFGNSAAAVDEFSAIPEPSALVMLVSCIAGLFLQRYRKTGS